MIRSNRGNGSTMRNKHREEEKKIKNKNKKASDWADQM